MFHSGECSKSWCVQTPNKNLVFSPSSLEQMLGMLYLGADGKTAIELEDILYAGNRNRGEKPPFRDGADTDIEGITTNRIEIDGKGIKTGNSILRHEFDRCHRYIR